MKMDQVEMPVRLGGQMLRCLALMEFNDSLFNRRGEGRVVERIEIAVAQVQFGRLEHGKDLPVRNCPSGCRSRRTLRLWQEGKNVSRLGTTRVFCRWRWVSGGGATSANQACGERECDAGPAPLLRGGESRNISEDKGFVGKIDQLFGEERSFLAIGREESFVSGGGARS